MCIYIRGGPASERFTRFTIQRYFYLCSLMGNKPDEGYPAHPFKAGNLGKAEGRHLKNYAKISTGRKPYICLAISRRAAANTMPSSCACGVEGSICRACCSGSPRDRIIKAKNKTFGLGTADGVAYWLCNFFGNCSVPGGTKSRRTEWRSQRTVATPQADSGPSMVVRTSTERAAAVQKPGATGQGPTAVVLRHRQRWLSIHGNAEVRRNQL